MELVGCNYCFDARSFLPYRNYSISKKTLLTSCSWRMLFVLMETCMVLSPQSSSQSKLVADRILLVFETMNDCNSILTAKCVYCICIWKHFCSGRRSRKLLNQTWFCTIVIQRLDTGSYGSYVRCVPCFEIWHIFWTYKMITIRSACPIPWGGRSSEDSTRRCAKPKEHESVQESVHSVHSENLLWQSGIRCIKVALSVANPYLFRTQCDVCIYCTAYICTYTISLIHIICRQNCRPARPHTACVGATLCPAFASDCKTWCNMMKHN